MGRILLGGLGGRIFASSFLVAAEGIDDCGTSVHPKSTAFGGMKSLRG